MAFAIQAPRPRIGDKRFLAKGVPTSARASRWSPRSAVTGGGARRRRALPGFRPCAAVSALGVAGRSFGVATVELAAVVLHAIL